ncbi:MAG: tetratricopeptide repeat protein, partial [Candidatus Margulisbacteria bacterium]|nr:tetratricopeptide repeat protein [Candidatus Margulisiibacteriota bacterium]
MRFSIAILLLFALLLPLNALSNESGQLQAAQAFLNGLQLRQNKNNSGALALFRQSIKGTDFPLKDYTQFEIGQTLYLAGDYVAARPEFQNLINNYPQSLLLPRAALMVGKCYFNQKNFTFAKKMFASLVETFPNAKEAAEARYLIARTLEKEKKWQAAYAAYEETDLYHPLTYFGKKSRLAIKALKKTHKKELTVYKASAAALFKKGMAYFDQDDYQMAANIFNRLAREYPKSKYVMEAWLMLGRAEM